MTDITLGNLYAKLKELGGQINFILIHANLPDGTAYAEKHTLQCQNDKLTFPHFNYFLPSNLLPSSAVKVYGCICYILKC